ncbi:ABC transporter permease, partial [Escherichia coli]
MVPGVEKIDFDQREVDGAQKGTLNFQAGPKNLSVTYELANKTTKELLAGRQLNDGDNAKLDKTVVVDELVAKELYQDSTAAVNRTFPYKEQLFTIVGVTTNTSGAIGPGNDDSLLYFPKKTYEHYFGKLK